MKRTVISWILVCALAFALGGCGSSQASGGNAVGATQSSESSAEENTTSGEDESAAAATDSASLAEADSGLVFDLPYGGVTFTLPESLRETFGVLRPAYGTEFIPNSGVYVSVLAYFSLPEEEYAERSADGEFMSDEDREYLGKHVMNVIQIMGIDGGRSQEELTGILQPYGLTAELYEPLGTAGEYNYFYIMNPNASQIEEGTIELEGEYKEEYDFILEDLKDLSFVSLREPEPMPETSGMNFTATDLEGNTVSGSEIFASHKLTLVNIWGTFCGPCISEMPELEKLNQSLAEKDCGIIGIVCDVQGTGDTALIQEAKDIVADTGVTYTNLIPWDGFAATFPASMIPTTYLVDSEGNIVGEPAVGARDARAYTALIDEALESLDK